MSLLDKQEVHDICEHTALRARKWSGLCINERQKIRHYPLGLLKKEEEEDRMKKNAKSRFFLLCTVRT